MEMDTQDGHSETVPFSVMFFTHNKQTLLIHRTNWNRLDISAPSTGALLTERTFADNYGAEYFHGGLYSSPDGKKVLDDGWVWHPIGWPSLFLPNR